MMHGRKNIKLRNMRVNIQIPLLCKAMMMMMMIIIIIIIIQFNYSLMVNNKVIVSRKKQQTKSRQALTTNKVSQLITFTDQPSCY